MKRKKKNEKERTKSEKKEKALLGIEHLPLHRAKYFFFGKKKYNGTIPPDNYRSKAASTESTYVSDKDFGLIHAIPTASTISTTEGDVSWPLDRIQRTPCAN